MRVIKDMPVEIYPKSILYKNYTSTQFKLGIFRWHSAYEVLDHIKFLFRNIYIHITVFCSANLAYIIGLLIFILVTKGMNTNGV